VERVVELDRGGIVLDQRVTTSALDERLKCRVELVRMEESARQSLLEWGFREVSTEPAVFEGSVAAPDRLRFFGMLARYAGLVAGLSLGEGASS
jgi:ABC-2 type transport system ATP-binding protein